ncbi:DUF3106 domain-containing protein [Pulveribacter suum]|uniref:DUF3106 domain-containing protein n=1 Tax=Pulveribacter suum TaxID=2116657 RepID=A0A2P1NL43_9BURK|nr:DUF3106 domain-containing protein [Pulveribacter suum]AVP57775.1 hypothetical protein C7H73_08960 [Pulveribacter suum]
MTASPPQRSPRLVPALVLASLLLAGLAATGWRAIGWVRMAPSTPVPVQALADSRHRAAGETRAVAQPEVGPPWSALTTAQKEALYPLASRWSVLSEAQKLHWLKLAAGFHSLAPREQEKMLARLTDWASLSAQQRSQARLNYAATTALAPDSKRAKWEAYQALSEEEKQRLAARAVRRPAGAATAVRPSPKKLVRVPAAISAPAAVANPPKIPRPAEPHLPQALPVPPPVVVETRPVEMPSAQPQSLPPLPLGVESPPAPPQEPLSGHMEPLHPPQ